MFDKIKGLYEQVIAATGASGWVMAAGFPEYRPVGVVRG